MTSHLSRTLLAEATREHVLCVAEVVLNTLESNLELPHSTLSELSRSKRVLRKVSRIVRGIGSGSDSGNGATHDPRSHHGTTIRVDASGRRQLKQVYVRHYKTIVEFLERCLPHLKKLLLSYDGFYDEI